MRSDLHCSTLGSCNDEKCDFDQSIEVWKDVKKKKLFPRGAEIIAYSWNSRVIIPFKEKECLENEWWRMKENSVLENTTKIAETWGHSTDSLL